MSLKIFNTLSKEKEKFVPLSHPFVGMYVCGPTVYGDAHIGHGKSYISFDVIFRYLKFLQYKVLYVQNITDVGHLLGEANEGEDRLLRQSKIEQKHPMEIAELYTRSFFEDMDLLNVERPHISPRATGHITEQIELIEILLEKGFAYENNGSVYFDVSKFKEYGKLSNRKLDEAISGTRVETRNEKKSPHDFALWKKAEVEHIMRWKSRWSVGFPGWHIECSAMSMKYLGETIDIHGGGIDNQFPHHECEIAQSESATEKQFVKYWIHNNLVTIDGQKMSKSLNNFVSLKNLFQKFGPLESRFFILQSHYRSTLDFSEEAILSSKKGYEKFLNFYFNLIERKTFSQTSNKIEVEKFYNSFFEAMNDDFNTAKAIAIIFDFIREFNSTISENKILSEENFSEIKNFIDTTCGKILGIIPNKIEKKISTDEDELMSLIINLRNELRDAKHFKFSDKIRNELENLNIVLEDTKEKTIWKKKN